MDEKGVRWDPNNADFEGTILKQSRWIGEWRKRYLVLKGSKLFFSKNETAAPHGLIDLIDCLTLESIDGVKNKASFEITLKIEKFLLVANSDKERDVWLEKISRVINKYRQAASSLDFIGEDDDESVDNER